MGMAPNSTASSAFVDAMASCVRANGTYERLVWNDRRGEYVRCAEAWETLARAATTTDDGGAFREFRGRFRLYFETDYAFLMDFVDVIARAFASTSKYGVKRRLGEFLGAIVVGEGEIFRKSLRALWAVSPETAAAKKETTGSLAARMSSFLRRVGDEGCFLTRIAVVAVAEGLYAGWAERASDEDVERTSRRETTPSSDGDVDDETLFRMEQELYAKWIHPLHASEEFKEAVKDFIDAFEEAWDDADDEARARAKRAIDEMLDLEVEFTRLLEV